MISLGIRMSCATPAAVCNDTTSIDFGWPIVALVLIGLVIAAVSVVGRIRSRRRRRNH